jgi:O-antigen/teichoic acid export membrane protein
MSSLLTNNRANRTFNGGIRQNVDNVFYDQRGSLLDGKTLAKNTAWNFLGQALPLLVGLAATPALIHRLGTDRFGVLTLAWLVVGYFTLFDFGLGRALTKLIAEKLGEGSGTDIPALFWTALLLMAALGLLGGAGLAFLTPWLTTHVLKIPRNILPETTLAFFWLSLGLPIVIVTAALQGVLAAYQQFMSFAALRLVTGMWSFLGPLLCLIVTSNLASIAAVLIAGRALACMLALWLSFRVDCRLRHPLWLRKTVRPLASFGGWMTVSNVVGPLMVYLDRFVVGAFLGMTAVAYYATPYDVVTRLLIIPTSLLGVLFPAFSTSLAVDRARAGRFFERAISFLFLLMYPITLILVMFAHEGLTLWLGNGFAVHSAPVLQWIAFGIFINSLGMVPFGSIQADGRPDVTAKLHLAELPIYFGILWVLLKKLGIEGAAIAWFLRVLLDSAVLYWIALRDLPEVRAGVVRKGCFILSSSAAILLIIWFQPSSLTLKVGLVSTCLATFSVFFWRLFLDASEKLWFLSYAREWLSI